VTQTKYENNWNHSVPPPFGGARLTEVGNRITLTLQNKKKRQALGGWCLPPHQKPSGARRSAPAGWIATLFQCAMPFGKNWWSNTLHQHLDRRCTITLVTRRTTCN